MKRSKTPSFALELPLVVTPGQERILLGRFEAARRLYNAVLGESLRRQKLMRESKRWQKARLLKDQKERSATFRKIGTEFGFTGAALSSFGTECKNAAGWSDRLGAHETQRIAERAFAAVESFGFGQRGKPRFKGKNRPLHSIEAKTNASGIRWKAGTSSVEWNKLFLPAMLAPQGTDAWQEEALSRRTKFCRIVWRNLNGKRRWYIQLLQEGLSPVKKNHSIGTGIVGLDIGPSTVAVIGEGAADLVAFCPTIKQPWAEVRRLQRALDRSRRATNPQCFNLDGTWKRGIRQTVFSARYRNLKTEITEAERRLAAERKRSHGELVNSILSHGTTIQSETLSYKAFQKRFGRSVKVKAPGMFVSLLRRKAESAGGEIRDLNTWSLKMSQYDHITGACTKKPLKQRWHQLGDHSTIVQRDLYSAFLARCVIDNQHHPTHIQTMWAAAEPLLRQAGWCITQPASREPKGFPTVKPSERVACRRRLAIGLHPDVVAVTREPGRPDGDTFRTPVFRHGEVQEPFADIVQGFAEMGYSRAAVARTLDINLSYFRMLLKRFDLHRHFLPQAQMRRECKGSGKGAPKGVQRAQKVERYSREQILDEVVRYPNYYLFVSLADINISTVYRRIGPFQKALEMARSLA